MTQEWITDRPPTAVDGDTDGDVRMQRAPGADSHRLVHWSYAGGAPWQHTSFWQPPAQPAPTEADRIAALEQRVADLRRGEDAVELIFSHLQSRLEALEGVQADGTVPAEADRIASRRVVQMVMAPSASNAFFVALCNDGSMWQLDEGNWIQLPAVPQP